MRNLIALLTLTYTITVGATSLNAAIEIQGYSATHNDRFTNSGDFILQGFNLSGIGQTSSGRWGTAISRNVILSADHAIPTGTISFHTDNSGATVVNRNIIAGVKVGSTDLYLAILDSNLPDSIAHYAYATEFLSGALPAGMPPFPIDPAGSLQGLNTYMVGRSPTPHTAIQSQAVGRNIITGYSENVPFLGNLNNDSIILSRDESLDANYTNFEAMFAGGDSGGPTFVDIGGELVLLGTNSFTYENPDFVIGGIGSGVTYIGNQATFISDYIALHAVPEPSSLTLLLAVVSFLLLRRGRSSNRLTETC